MKITGERDGFLTRDLSYFQNIYDSLHEDGDELFLVKLEPKPVLDDIDNELKELESEKRNFKINTRESKLKRLKIN